MAALSSAEVVWEGDAGRVKPDSGAFGELPVSFPTRVNREKGKTSPEEFLAASHASCYAMALAAVLGKSGKKAERMTVRATFEFDDKALKVTTVQLVARARVPGLDASAFDKTAKDAEALCPISNALRGNVAIKLDARLE